MRTVLATWAALSIGLLALAQNFPQPGPGASGFFGAGSPFATATACWSFNDPADLGNDDCTNTYDLTPVNSPTAVGGANSYGFYNADVDTRFVSTISDYPDLSAGSDWTFCIWGRPIAVVDDDVWAKKDDFGSEREWILRNNATTATLYRSRSCTSYVNLASAPSATVAGERTFICANYNNTTRTSFVFKNAVAGTESAGLSADMMDCGAPLEIGGATGGGAFRRGFNGTLGPAYWWKGQIVSTPTLTTLYNSGKGLDCATAIATDPTMTRCWDLDEDPAGGVDAYKEEVSGGASENMSPVNGPERLVGNVYRSDSGMSVQTVAASSQELTNSTNFSGDSTLCAWFWGAAVSSNFPVVSAADGQDGSINIYNGGGTPYAVVEAFDNTGWVAAGGYSAPFTKGDWVLVCGVMDWGVGLKVYVNGAQHGVTAALGSEQPAALSAFRVGRTRSGVLSDTVADMVALWPEAKGDAFMTELYAAGAGVFYAAYLDFLWDDQVHFAWRLEPELVRVH